MKLFYLILVLLLFFPFFVKGASLGDVLINEIAWMGTEISYNDEWVELYNSTENNISLDGWVLKAEDGTPEINLSGIIPEKGFYLLERTDDETIAEITADLIYKGALGNNGENLKLYDNSGNLIDEVVCKETWPAGDNQTKQTMERTSAGWQTSKELSGTPKAENSIVIQTEPQPQIKSDKPAVDDSRQQTYPSGVVFNEIMPSPEGPDETEEWIKISNQNDFEVDLSSWQIKDKEGKITTYTFPKETKIPALKYLVLKRPETKITLNNDGDGLELINPNGEIVDSMNFEKSPQNQSYIKTPSGWVWESTPPKNMTEVRPRLVDENKIAEKQTADIDLSVQKSKLPVLLITLIITIFSVIVILKLFQSRQNLINKV